MLTRGNIPDIEAVFLKLDVNLQNMFLVGGVVFEIYRINRLNRFLNLLDFSQFLFSRLLLLVGIVNLLFKHRACQNEEDEHHEEEACHQVGIACPEI